MGKEIQITTELTDNIVHRLMNGTPLTAICKDKGSPSLSVVYKWIAKDKTFADKIAEARRIGAQTYIDHCIEELQTADNKSIAVLREKLQMCRWLASKLVSVYGDKQEIKTDTKIEITWNTDNKVKTVEGEVIK